MASANDLQWVVSGPENRKISKEARTKIRKQAMRSVVEARRLLKQLEGQQDQGRDSQDGLLPAVPKSNDKKKRAPLPLQPQDAGTLIHLGRHGSSGLPFSLPPTGIELLVIQHGIDPRFYFSTFTSVNFETTASRIVNAYPERLSFLVCEVDQWHQSYFAHLGRAYGQFDYLDDALNVLVAKVKATLTPSQAPSDTVILSMYGRALKSLQAAVNTSDCWSRPELLCTTDMLALFELLNSAGIDKWRRHIAGAARLMQLRGPKQFTTDFELSLFLSLYAPICCESFVLGKVCFLEEDAWQDFFSSITVDTDPFSERGRLNMALARGMVKTPGFAVRIIKLLNRGGDGEAPNVKELASRLEIEVKKARKWQDDFRDALSSIPKKSKTPQLEAQLRALYGPGLVWGMLACRMLGAIVPKERPQLEHEARSQARELKRLESEVNPSDHRQLLLLAQKMSLADAFLMSIPAWNDALHSGQLMQASTFLYWCQLSSDMIHLKAGANPKSGG